MGIRDCRLKRKYLEKYLNGTVAPFQECYTQVHSHLENLITGILDNKVNDKLRSPLSVQMTLYIYTHTQKATEYTHKSK